MYIPEEYLESDRKEILSFIKNYSFACIVSSKNNIPMATHLPFVVEEKGKELLLTSHFAKANPHWKQIAESQALVIFSEPNAYISPRHYEKEKNVPTWNYIAVHAYGKGELIQAEVDSLLVLEKMIKKFEQGYKAQWDQLAMNYKQNMLKGIVAFQIKVTDIQAQKKLSQDKKEVERQKIISSLSESSNSQERNIAAYMKDLEKKNL